MLLRPVALPGPLVLAPFPSLEGNVRRLRVDHPFLPADVHELASDLDSREDGVPATIADSHGGGTDRSLLVHGRTYVARLIPGKRQQGVYGVSAILPLGFRDHHRVARGCLLVRPVRWVPGHLHGGAPGSSDAHWQRLVQAWQQLTEEIAARRGARAPAARHTRFLDDVEQVIDAGERITVARARAAGDFPYRSVSATGEQRHGTRAVYTFDLVEDRIPDEGAFVQVRGEPAQRGRVLTVASGGTSVTVAFDRAVAWDSVPAQGALRIVPGRAVHDRQRAAVRILRDGQSHSPHLLDVLVDHRVRPLSPASDEPEAELDPAQTEAFRKALAVEDLMLVLGPPGTGKTRVISEISRAIAAREARERVLIASHSNRAVDNVLGRLPRDMVVVRVGNEGAVTAEGRPYLLEEQATGLRQEILARLETRLAVPLDVERAEKWCDELGLLLARLRALAGEEEAARSALADARRAVGGPAVSRVDELVAGRARLERATGRHARRTERWTRARDSALRRADRRLTGSLFRLFARRCERRLARAARAAAALADEQARHRTAWDLAEHDLELATRDIPAVRAAAVSLEEVSARAAACRADAVEAAGYCRSAVAAVEEMPALHDPRTARPRTVDRELTRLHDRLMQRLPLLASRRALLAEWREEVSSATGQLHTELVRYAHVVAATCIGVASRPELTGLDFDLAVIDEAGQIGVPDVLVPLVRARRAVLVGDHRQLPPYVDSEVRQWGEGCGDAAVPPLLTTSALEMLRPVLPDEAVVPLTDQRRMPSAVARFVSAAFYDGQLRTPDPDPPHDSRLFRTPMAFVDTSRLPAGRRFEREAGDAELRKGYVNPAEADLLTLLAAHYDGRGEEWAVIVPYAAQAALIKADLTRCTGRPERARRNVGTVDSFQGGERDVILYGFTRSNPGGRVGFLAELRRANVALTRVRRQLVLVGDLSTLTRAKDAGFRDLSRALRDHLAGCGETRSYEEVRAMLERLRAAGDGT
ncbi:AAA domain-containing protein [Streptomyces sp. ALI-76-A]|uniref:DEAD/DEAH box helicase n=1 Tax=Streptomyces sp. ALI-76-A TaxID=3025736 RepID=UPI00256EF101|nr:AAA domain-containing protein [Streptomyces sp. ALI-76-A]MDL5205242.1 AAA domain-containing protein [Streptomyces sp. ALI-76-A]